MQGGIWGRTSLVGWWREKIAGWSGFLSVRSKWFNFLCSGNAVATHRKALIIVKILHWKSIYTCSSPLLHRKLCGHTAPPGTPFSSLSMVFVCSLHTSLLQIEYMLQTAPCAMKCTLKRQVSLQAQRTFQWMQISCPSISLPEWKQHCWWFAFASNLSCDAVGSSDALYFA